MRLPPDRDYFVVLLCWNCGGWSGDGDGLVCGVLGVGCGLTAKVGFGSIYSMETMSTSQAYGGVGAAVDDASVKQEKRSLVRSVFAWVYDRFDFWVIHRGRRLRPEVGEELLKDVEEVRSGRDTSPGFSNAKDAVAWLKSQA